MRPFEISDFQTTDMMKTTISLGHGYRGTKFYLTTYDRTTSKAFVLSKMTTVSDLPMFRALVINMK